MATQLVDFVVTIDDMYARLEPQTVRAQEQAHEQTIRTREIEFWVEVLQKRGFHVKITDKRKNRRRKWWSLLG